MARHQPHPIRLIATTLALSFAALLLVADRPAVAREVVLASEPNGGWFGPVLSDGRVVWTTTRANLLGKRVLMRAKGRTRTILRVPDPASGQTNFRSIAASGRRIAVLYGDPAHGAPGELMVSSGKGFRRAALAPGCNAQTADIDGPYIAYAAICDGISEVRVQGGGQTFRVAAQPIGFLHAKVRIAGRYVAYGEAQLPPEQSRLIVYDLRRRRIALRLDLTQILEGGYQGVGNKWVDFDLDRSGRIAFKAGVVPEYHPRVVGWASPAHPSIYRFRPEAKSPIAIAGRFIALQRERSHVVLNLKGKVVNVFDRKRTKAAGNIAFDGTRLAWVGMVYTRTGVLGTRVDLVTNLFEN